MTQHIYGPPHSFFDLGDSSVPYWRMGKGPDLVFIHGWPLDGRTWRHQVERLKDHFTCHIIDLPRAGLSRWSKATRIGVKVYGDIVYEAVQQMTFEGDTFGFVGHNTGGSYLRLAAAQMPDRISGIVLGNTEIPYRHSLPLRFLFTLGKFRSLEAILRLTLRQRIGRSALLVMAHAHSHLLQGEFTKMFLHPLLENPGLMAGAAETLRHVRVCDFDQLQAAHGAITAPVKLVWGKDDWWFPSGRARKMLKEFAGRADCSEISPGRLMIHEEQAALFSDHIVAHFKVQLKADEACSSKQNA